MSFEYVQIGDVKRHPSHRGSYGAIFMIDQKVPTAIGSVDLVFVSKTQFPSEIRIMKATGEGSVVMGPDLFHSTDPRLDLEMALNVWLNWQLTDFGKAI